MNSEFSAVLQHSLCFKLLICYNVLKLDWLDLYVIGDLIAQIVILSVKISDMF